MNTIQAKEILNTALKGEAYELVSLDYSGEKDLYFAILQTTATVEAMNKPDGSMSIDTVTPIKDGVEIVVTIRKKWRSPVCSDCIIENDRDKCEQYRELYPEYCLTCLKFGQK